MHQTGEKNLGRPFFWNGEILRKRLPERSVWRFEYNATLGACPGIGQESAGSKRRQRQENRLAVTGPHFWGRRGWQVDGDGLAG